MDLCLQCNGNEWCHVLCVELIMRTRFINNSNVLNSLYTSLPIKRFTIPSKPSIRDQLIRSSKIANIVPSSSVVVSTPIRPPTSTTIFHCSICGHPILGRAIHCWYSASPSSHAQPRQMFFLCPPDLSGPHGLLLLVFPLRPSRAQRQGPRGLSRPQPVFRFQSLSPHCLLSPDLPPRRARLRTRPRRFPAPRPPRTAGIPPRNPHGDAKPPAAVSPAHQRAPIAPSSRGGIFRGSAAGGASGSFEAECTSSRLHGAPVRVGSGGNAVVRNGRGVLAELPALGGRSAVPGRGALHFGGKTRGGQRGGAERAVELVRRAAFAAMQRNRGDAAGARAAAGVLHRGIAAVREASARGEGEFRGNGGDDGVDGRTAGQRDRRVVDADDQ